MRPRLCEHFHTKHIYFREDGNRHLHAMLQSEMGSMVTAVLPEDFTVTDWEIMQ